MSKYWVSGRPWSFSSNHEMKKLQTRFMRVTARVSDSAWKMNLLGKGSVSNTWKSAHIFQLPLIWLLFGESTFSRALLVSPSKKHSFKSQSSSRSVMSRQGRTWRYSWWRSLTNTVPSFKSSCLLQPTGLQTWMGNIAGCRPVWSGSCDNDVQRHTSFSMSFILCGVLPTEWT